MWSVAIKSFQIRTFDNNIAVKEARMEYVAAWSQKHCDEIIKKMVENGEMIDKKYWIEDPNDLMVGKVRFGGGSMPSHSLAESAREYLEERRMGLAGVVKKHINNGVTDPTDILELISPTIRNDREYNKWMRRIATIVAKIK